MEEKIKTAKEYEVLRKILRESEKVGAEIKKLRSDKTILDKNIIKKLRANFRTRARAKTS